jgi:hypothetical protein
VRQDERESLLREDVSRAETARERRQLEAIAEDLSSSPLRGRPLPLRLRNFRPAAEGYLASLGGPLPYMGRLRDIDALTIEHEQRLASAYEALGADPDAWQALVRQWDFGEVNELIDRHNRWYPAESRLPMDPRTGDYALVNGRSYRRRPLDASWVLERFPSPRA